MMKNSLFCLGGQASLLSLMALHLLHPTWLKHGFDTMQSSDTTKSNCHPMTAVK